MDTSLFDYNLPPDRIAQHSVEPRDQAKLLVVNRESGGLLDKHVFDLPEFIQPDDLLVFNDSKVFKARLQAKLPTGTSVEIFLLRPEGNLWLCLAHYGRRLKIGGQIIFADGTTATVMEKRPEGIFALDFHKSPDEVFSLADKFGQIPVPPYVKEQPAALEKYQTIYARERGSVAAPTAGFHFTPELFAALDKKGVHRAFVTLHVGLGTFRPMKSQTLEEHVMHEEWYSVPTETLELIKRTKQAGHRVIAIGTTTVRALESAATGNAGFTKLFITPGYKFKNVDGLMTNFHLPKSTLLVLVSALAGRELILKAYEHAVANGYRFYSFGDAMLII